MITDVHVTIWEFIYIVIPAQAGTGAINLLKHFWVHIAHGLGPPLPVHRGAKAPPIKNCHPMT